MYGNNYLYKECCKPHMSLVCGVYGTTSAGTVDYTGGEEVRTNLLESNSSAKPEANEPFSSW